MSAGHYNAVSGVFSFYFLAGGVGPAPPDVGQPGTIGKSTG